MSSTAIIGIIFIFILLFLNSKIKRGFDLSKSEDLPLGKLNEELDLKAITIQELNKKVDDYFYGKGLKKESGVLPAEFMIEKMTYDKLSGENSKFYFSDVDTLISRYLLRGLKDRKFKFIIENIYYSNDHRKMRVNVIATQYEEVLTEFRDQDRYGEEYYDG
jgi:hypothetical protein